MLYVHCLFYLLSVNFSYISARFRGFAFFAKPFL